MPQQFIRADQLVTNVAGGLLEINGSGQIDTSFLETDVANGVPQLDGSGEVPTTLLQTNVANGVAGLNASAEIATSLLETDVANGVPQLNGSIEIPTTLLQTNVANGVAGLNASTEIATSLLETNVANGVAGLNASAEIATSLLETDVANGVPSLDANSDLSLQGFDVTYNEARATLGGDFDAGQEVVVVRVGNMVTLTSAGALTHPSSVGPQSALSVIPTAFRPTATVRNTIRNVTTSVPACDVRVTTDGTVSLQYNDETGALQSQTTTSDTLTVFWVIEGNIA